MALASVPRVPAANLRRNPSSPWRHLDVSLVAATIAIACLGTLMVYSATRSVAAGAGLASTTYLFRQGAFLVLGVGVMAAVAFVDYRNMKELSLFLWLGAVGLLVIVLSPFGTEVNGAQSWFAFGSFQLQPAELAKLAVILLLAAYASSHQGDLDGRRLALCLCIAGVPVGLIFLQPDIGSMLVFVAIVMGVLLVAGARPRHIVALTVIGILGVVAAFQLDILADYQRERLTSFASPGADDQGAGYNREQALIGVSSGGWFGAGLFEGTQTKLGFVPEQQTDFIFTVVGEELGFAGSATLLVLYAFMIWRIWRSAQVAKDFFGTLVCTGVMSMLLFQIFENMGMAMGMMPITGVPLPFLSYGGSSTLTMFAAIGLVLNVYMRRFS